MTRPRHVRDMPHRWTRARWRPQSSTSTTSASTATSAAWSTARAWPWRPWTSRAKRGRARQLPRRRGSASVKNIKGAFEIITRDPKVKCILVNIFGGIMKCDVIAEGVKQAAAEMDLKIPLVVRLEGTNVAAGNKIIKDANLATLISADDLDDAAEKAVQAIS